MADEVKINIKPTNEENYFTLVEKLRQHAHDRIKQFEYSKRNERKKNDT